jgi:hypothetical protein
MRFAILAVLIAASSAKAFCGFYVAKADAKLFNKASQVVLVRDEDKTVLTMASDYQGKVKDFAMVIPVPTEIQREQIHIGDMKIVDHLDAYSGPRLVEYNDENPCEPRREYKHKGRAAGKKMALAMEEKEESAKALGVKIEASYTVGEYDILILSAQQSSGLITWLKQQGYKIPDGAEPVVSSYLDQKMHWFVAKVNLAEHDKLGGGKLRPIQVAYQSPKFMLPIRLGTVNSDGSQDMFVYTLTKTGRVEATNYRTVKLPSDVEVPEYTKDVFGDFYKAMFTKAVDANDKKAVFTEYAWDMNWCDPCAADPLSAEELKGLGVFWEGTPFITRLHVRYDREHFPEDLVFQSTTDRANFQGRYIMRHPFKGAMTCDQAVDYKKTVYDRSKQEAKNLADLTGWSVDDVEKKMNLGAAPAEDKWYQRLWK